MDKDTLSKVLRELSELQTYVHQQVRVIERLIHPDEDSQAFIERCMEASAADALKLEYTEPQEFGGPLAPGETVTFNWSCSAPVFRPMALDLTEGSDSDLSVERIIQVNIVVFDCINGSKLTLRDLCAKNCLSYLALAPSNRMQITVSNKGAVNKFFGARWVGLVAADG